MKPSEGRQRVVIEEVQPQVNCGRYAARRFLGDQVEIRAAIFSDGHDHVAAELLYKREGEHAWHSTRMTALVNDMWTAQFPVDALGPWRFTIRAWVDHFETWCADLHKRLDAQPTPDNPSLPPQDIPLAFTIGASLLDQIAARASGDDLKQLKSAARHLRELAELKFPFYDDPLTSELKALAARHPDHSFATTYEKELPLWIDRERARFSSWYELFPRSAAPAAKGDQPAAKENQLDPDRHGTLADVAALVPRIVDLGFDILYLPPIHPIGSAFRKGKNNAVTAQPADEGCPWAIGDRHAGVPGGGGHKSIHPKLGTYADLDHLISTLHANGMELAMDIAFQCSPDHPWVAEHPEWFLHRPDGTIQYAENPPKKYQDIYPLNFESPAWQSLWDELRSVFQFWIDRGVKVFRVDNPHTKALAFWEWCITELHASSPDVIFLAEAFTRPHVMYSLAKTGYTQSYTYFTWRTEKPEIEAYFKEITQPPVSDFFTPNLWPNTPDILHASLQQGGRPAFMSRLILATTLAANYGIYGPAYELGENVPVKEGSEEYLNSEKYEIRHWDCNAPGSIAPLVSLLNKIRHENPALQSDGSLHFHRVDNPWIICYSKTTLPPPAPMTLAEAEALGGHNAHRGVAPPTRSESSSPAVATEDAPPNIILTVVNLDPHNDQAGWVSLDLDELGLRTDESYDVEDLLTGAHYAWRGRSNYVALHPSAIPAHILRITGR